MTEQMVQVPVSLIEAVYDCSDDGIVLPRIYVERLRALLSQPTPSAEAVCACGHPEFDHGHSEGDGCLHCPCKEFATTPPRIQDMAPGTTFEYPFRWEVGAHKSTSGRTVAHMTGRIGTAVWLDDLDPSTIRDVQPPARREED